MSHHSFIFSPGRWLGKGTITIQGAVKPIGFYVCWQISQAKGESFTATQTVEIEGVAEHVVTSYVFIDITETTFAVFLDSNSVGQVVGKGILTPDTVAWEYHAPELEGFEVYKKQENGHYSLHAEYSSTSQYRTIIEGIVWKT
jgi:hypothetical protein